MISLKEIQEFINGIADSGITEVDINTESVKLKLSFGRNIETNSFNVSSEEKIFSTPKTESKTEVLIPEKNSGISNENIQPEKNLITIKSPMIGTFYRKPSPDKPTFVNVGDEISEGKILCIIEAMKLFNEIEAEISGKIVKVLVEDATPVEYDQPLFLIEQ